MEINAFGSYSTGNFDRVNSDVYENPTLDEHWTEPDKNNAWRGGAEVMYSKSFGQNLATNFGIKDYYNSTDNSQTNNTDLSEEKNRPELCHCVCTAIRTNQEIQL